MQTVWRLSELVSITGGELTGSVAEDATFGGIVYPLKLVAENTILVHCSSPDWPARPVKLSGQRRHDLEGLLHYAADQRAALVITSESPPASPPLPVLKVADSHRAFFQLADYGRNRFRGRVIAVTGTVGKSTTRDLLGRFLSHAGSCITSFGNWNTVEGSAMCLNSLPAETDFCIVEQSEESIRGHHGHSSVLTVRPDELVVTKLGFGNVQRFSSIEELARVISNQISALPDHGRLYFSSSVQCRHILESALERTALHVAGESSGAGVDIRILDSSIAGSIVRLSSRGETIDVETPVIGDGWIENIRLASLCAHMNGVTLEQIAGKIRTLTPIPKKMEPTHSVIAGSEVLLLDDSYNAEVESFENALSFFGRAARNFSRRVVIAGKIVNVGGAEEYAYGRVAESVLACKPSAVILFGDSLENLAYALENKATVLRAPRPNDVLALLETLVDENTTLLLKGSSRNTRLKQLSGLLRAGTQEPSAIKANSPPRLPQTLRDALYSPRELEISWPGDFSVAFLGDTYFGEYYAERAAALRRPHPLLEGDYEGWITEFGSFLSSNILNIANLETPLTKLQHSPYNKERPYPHRAEPEKTLRALTRANIDVVTLGNNHLFDYGDQGIVDTLSHVEGSSLTSIGAGTDATDAARPLVLWVDQAADGITAPPSRQLIVFSGFAYRRAMDERFEAYATMDRPGCNRIDRQTVAGVAAAREHYPDALIVVVPHWRRDYLWASSRQRDFAQDVLAAGADLLIGHGAHMLQQVERFHGRLAVHGIGNFVFHSPGRTRKMYAQPISAIARLMVPAELTASALVRLYPIFTDNRASGYRTHFLTEREFEAFVPRYIELGFLPGDAKLDRDEFGHFIEMATTSDPQDAPP